MSYEAFLEVVHSDDRQRVAVAVEQAIEGESSYSINHRIVLPSGRTKIVHEQGKVLRDANGNVTAMTGIVQDVTRQQEREAQLRNARDMAEVANRAKSEFLANMSHELRTPLNAVIGFSEVMTQELLGPLKPKKYQSYAKDITESGKHLLGLINNVLDMSKIESGRMTLSEGEIDVTSVLRYCERLFSGQALDKGITLFCHWQAEAPRLYADELLVRQILINLVSNAIKFTSHGGHVMARTFKAEDGGLIVDITDSGIGMTQEEVGRSMEVFGQADNSIRRKFGGAGLGLPLTLSLLKLHQGALKIDSEPGRGTSVRAWFPKARVVKRRPFRSRP